MLPAEILVPAMIGGLLLWIVAAKKNFGSLTMFYIFLLASLFDVTSTLLSIYGIDGGNWSRESNILIRTWGPHTGFPQALMLQNLLVITVAWIVAWAGKGWNAINIAAISFLAMVAGGRFIVALSNTTEVILLWTPR